MTTTDRETRSQPPVVMEIGFGERKVGFMREPDMQPYEGGNIFIVWRGELATVAYYQTVPSERRIGFGMVDMVAIQENVRDFEAGVIDAPQDKEHTAFVKKWERAIGADGSLDLEHVDKNGPGILQIRLKPVAFENPPQQST